jgi:hypothetical protein
MVIRIMEPTFVEWNRNLVEEPVLQTAISKTRKTILHIRILVAKVHATAAEAKSENADCASTDSVLPSS